MATKTDTDIIEIVNDACVCDKSNRFSLNKKNVYETKNLKNFNINKKKIKYKLQ